ncbi:MAG TPA: arsenate reductase ArsC [Nitrososphaerales archaeon]|nr:arsenate reductase ArsC [Nitrososphaerales archaeon]
MKRSAENPQILFVCEDNAGPSQMAEAFAEKFGMKASSAGRHAKAVLNPNAVQAMKESGIDISRNKPKSLTPQIINAASLVVTIGCSFEGASPVCMQSQIREKTIQWNWKGLKRRNISDVREIRDEIERRVNGLSRDL